MRRESHRSEAGLQVLDVLRDEAGELQEGLGAAGGRLVRLRAHQLHVQRAAEVLLDHVAPARQIFSGFFLY